MLDDGFDGSRLGLVAIAEVAKRNRNGQRLCAWSLELGSMWPLPNWERQPIAVQHRVAARPDELILPLTERSNISGAIDADAGAGLEDDASSTIRV